MTRTRFRFTAIALSALGLLLLPVASQAAKDPVQQSLFGVAIAGADPVAYFSEERHVEGSSDFEAEWMEATWRFASAENRDLFLAEPEKYAPQYGGYCAFAVAHGYTAKIDPEAWRVVEDKLYLNYSPEIQKKWEAQRDAFIERANENWPKVLDK